MGKQLKASKRELGVHYNLNYILFIYYKNRTRTMQQQQH